MCVYAFVCGCVCVCVDDSPTPWPCRSLLHIHEYTSVLGGVAGSGGLSDKRVPAFELPPPLLDIGSDVGSCERAQCFTLPRSAPPLSLSLPLQSQAVGCLSAGLWATDMTYRSYHSLSPTSCQPIAVLR